MKHSPVVKAFAAAKAPRASELAAELKKTDGNLEALRAGVARRTARIEELDRELAEAKAANDALRETNLRLEAQARAQADEIKTFAGQMDELRRRLDVASDAPRLADEITRLKTVLEQERRAVALHRLRDDRAHEALAGLALRLGRAEQQLADYEDEDVMREAAKTTPRVVLDRNHV